MVTSTVIPKLATGAPLPAGAAAPVAAPPVAPAAPAAHDAAAAAEAGRASDSLKRAAERASQALEQTNRELSFVFDDKLGRMLVKIVDKRTRQVVEQVPSEDMLALARAMSDSRKSGLLVKSRA
jgi:flagellar protein FlaG